MNKEITTGIAVVRTAGQYLVGVRPVGTDLAGYHEFPGGKCKPGETPEACAERECLEETGIIGQTVRRLLETRHVYDHGSVLLNFVLCETALTDAGELPEPRPQFRWVDAFGLQKLRFPEGNAEVLTLLAEMDSDDWDASH